MRIPLVTVHLILFCMLFLLMGCCHPKSSLLQDYLKLFCPQEACTYLMSHWNGFGSSDEPQSVIQAWPMVNLWNLSMSNTLSSSTSHHFTYHYPLHQHCYYHHNHQCYLCTKVNQDKLCMLTTRKQKLGQCNNVNNIVRIIPLIVTTAIWINTFPHLIIPLKFTLHMSRNSYVQTHLNMSNDTQED